MFKHMFINTFESPNSSTMGTQNGNSLFIEYEQKFTKRFLTVGELESKILDFNGTNEKCSSSNSDSGVGKSEFVCESSGSTDQKSSDDVKCVKQNFNAGSRCLNKNSQSTPNKKGAGCTSDKSGIKSHRTCRSLTDSSCDLSDSDSCLSDKCFSTVTPGRKKLTRTTKLPPIGVFWDIENVQVPRGRSAVGVAQQIRDMFFDGYREAEFVVVCDARKESPQVLQELNNAQVNLIHVASTCKNAADEKLRQSMRRFADTHKYPCAMILISSDINFAADLSDLRHRKRIHVKLLHNEHVSEALLLCANEHYLFNCVVDNAPMRDNKLASPVQQQVQVVVRNLPVGHDRSALMRRLKQLSYNCGGRIESIATTGEAFIKFSSMDYGLRAQKRMDGEDVFGHKISVGYPTPIRNSPFKNTPGRKTNSRSNMDDTFQQQISTATFQNNVPLTSPSLFGLFHPTPVTQMTASHFPFAVNTAAFCTTDNRSNTEAIFDSWLITEQLKEQQQALLIKNAVEQANARAVENARAMHNNFVMPQPLQPHAMNRTRTPVEQRNGSAPAVIRRSRTPNSYASANQRNSWPYGPVNGNMLAANEMNDETEHQYQNMNTSTSSGTVGSAHPVELIVTNLDSSIDPQEMRRMLLCLFREHANIIYINVYAQAGGNLAASIKVATFQDAQYAISQLHRRRVGHKRITIAYANNSPSDPQQLHAQVVGLLKDVPGNKLPLFKFRELFESRYHTSVSVSELYKLRDVCLVSEEPTGRMVSLWRDVISSSPSPVFDQQDVVGVDRVFCPKHVAPSTAKGWAEQDEVQMPNVRIGLKVFTARVHSLLHSHGGSLPFYSFHTCYEAEIGEPLPIDDTGVPLEHLVTCVTGVELRSGPGKRMVWALQSTPDEYMTDDCSSTSGLALKCVSPPLANQLSTISRELVDLLKTTPKCSLQFNRFIPAYHHHFGKQCRVADYGFTKLIDLFDSLSHVIQVIGEGNKRTITLSHRAQIRRFTGDLLRTLKASVSRQVSVAEFPAAAEKTLERQWDPTYYGVCELWDLLTSLPENIVVVTGTGEDALIALPKREQTPEEIVKTKQFAIEVVELLKHSPNCSMLFNKFVPAYHHHFGHQCRVSDYGFTKLIELFESIPEVVKVEEKPSEDRMVRLTEDVALRVLAEQIADLIKTYGSSAGMLLTSVAPSYIQQYGHALKHKEYGCNTLSDLIAKLGSTVKLVSNTNGQMVQLVDRTFLRTLSLRIWRLLLNIPDYTVTVTALLEAYESTYSHPCDISQLHKITAVVKINHNTPTMTVSLTPLYTFGAQAYSVLYEFQGGCATLGVFENAFLHKLGVPVRPAASNYQNISSLVGALPDILVLGGRKRNRTVALKRNLAAYGVPLPPLHFQPNVSGGLSSSCSDQSSSSSTSNSKLSSLGSAVQAILWPASGVYVPPKPDTPPSQVNSFWTEYWSAPPDNNVNLAIQLPHLTATVPDIAGSLLSPTRNLLPATENPATPIQAPPPSALPKPNLQQFNSSLSSTPTPDKEKTSFFKSTKNVDNNSPTAHSPNTLNKSKRKLRLAAQFNTPISLT